MIEFKKTLEQRIIDICKNAVGEDTDPDNFVRTFDTYLHDIEFENYPFIAVSVRQGQEENQAELTTQRDLWEWTVHIYYLDILQQEGQEFYYVGDNKRQNILGRIERDIIVDRRLGNIESNDEKTGIREYVYDTRVTNILFDSSGQEEYYAFVSEMYISVFTAKT